MPNSNDSTPGQDDPELSALLKDYPMPQPHASFFDQSLARATHEGSRRQRNRWVATGFVSALAAGLAFWMIGGLWLSPSDTPALDATIPSIAMSVEEPHTIQLQFASNMALDDATLTVSLPRGVELFGFPGQQTITWQTSLSPGKNRLPLKLIATSAVRGEVLATLMHDNRSRTFRLQVDVS